MSLCFFFNDTATTEIYTLSLHDALPISVERFEDLLINEVQRVDCARWHDGARVLLGDAAHAMSPTAGQGANSALDRKSTRLNSSHANISYAVFCLKKKNHKLRQSPPYSR